MITLTNLVAIINGRLLNSPFVTKFSNIAFSLEELSFQGVFFSDSTDEIAQALKKGAYGIVSSVKIVDEYEGAYIFTDSLEDAKIRILRYILLEKNICPISTSYAGAILASCIIQPEVAVSFRDMSRFQILKNSPKFAFIEDGLLLRLALNSENKNITPSTKLQTKGLFHTTLTSPFYKELELLSPFADDLAVVLDSCVFYDIEFNLKHIRKNPLYTVFYLSSNLSLRSDGGGSKAIISVKDVILYEKIALWMDENIKYSESIYISDIKNIKCHKRTLFTNENIPIKTILGSNFFRYAVVLNSDETSLISQFEQKKADYSLF